MKTEEHLEDLGARIDRNYSELYDLILTLKGELNFLQKVYGQLNTFVAKLDHKIDGILNGVVYKRDSTTTSPYYPFDHFRPHTDGIIAASEEEAT